MRSGFSDPSTWIFAALAVLLAIVAWLKDPGLPAVGVRNGLSLLWLVLPRLIPALILTGLIRVLMRRPVMSWRLVSVRVLASLALPILAGWLVALFYPD